METRLERARRTILEVQEGGDEKKKRETRKRDDHEHSPARVQGK
jgi:hypothetical protein